MGNNKNGEKFTGIVAGIIFQLFVGLVGSIIGALFLWRYATDTFNTVIVILTSIMIGMAVSSIVFLLSKL